MAKNFDAMEDSNCSSNLSIHELSDPARRTVLRGGLGLAASALYAPLVAGCAAAATREAPKALLPVIGFKGVPAVATEHAGRARGLHRLRDRGLGRARGRARQHASLAR